MNLPVVASIGCTDPWNASGLGLDILALRDAGARAVTVVAGVTAQDRVGVHAASSVAPELIMSQLRSLSDAGIAAYRIGALLDRKAVVAIADWLTTSSVPAVYDPVLGPSGGGSFADAATIEAIAQYLLPVVTVATPNLGEALRLAQVGSCRNLLDNPATHAEPNSGYRDDAGSSDADRSDTELSDTGRSDADRSDAERRDIGRRDLKRSNTGRSDTEATEVVPSHGDPNDGSYIDSAPRLHLENPFTPSGSSEGDALAAVLESAGRELVGRGARAVLVTGGDLPGRAIDVLVDGTGMAVFEAERLAGTLRGTGCLLSCGIAAALARGESLREAVAAGRAFVRARFAGAVETGGMRLAY